jgi:ArsR family transcriptional regulator, arsenate/arsenite/antimonite-responsive transcriptional repressor
MNESPFTSETQVEEVSQFLKALADPNRLRIFAALIQGDSCNARLNEQLGLAPNLLSHHLRALREAGLVHDRRDKFDARWIYYTVDRENVKKWCDWLNTFLDPVQLKESPDVCGPEREVANDLSLTFPQGLQ